ncbi:hypothetical protein PHISCL_06888 [Aspergillus sclerotialis]|uniref:Uncharacterized protein n=1 Tax=Aspergillus sclerotialis TaxID=2070753 RepID=A0A3A2ZC75_9EURO|nr:hypothetical protein PHISCL_06888 [Aspergillus sclerotialis]
MRRFSQISFGRRSSQFEPSYDPVLTAEDEAFFQKLASAEPAPLPNDEISTTSPVGEDPKNTPLPPSPVEENGKEKDQENLKPGEELQDQAKVPELSAQELPTGKEKRRRPWSRIFRMGSVSHHKDGNPTGSSTSTTEQNRRCSYHSGNTKIKEDKQEPEDITDILERLNLAADNNRVFSISDETQELLGKFKLIFKDLVNGVPTAYHDLEMLLDNGNHQLQKSYSQLPSFLQKMIEKLPEKWTESFAPEILAAASERAGKSGINTENVGKAAAAANKMGFKVPSLKELVGKPAAIVGMLRSIITFLKARFPAVIGMNVLWSLALFILLFVLWYCHKRGREVRLENERIVTEQEMQKMNEAVDGQIRPTETFVTTAPQGASVEQVREGVQEAQETREMVEPVAEQEQKKANRMSTMTLPSRSKSKLSIWSRSQKPTASKIEPYPGT